MSQFTDFGENKLADFLRGQGLAALAGSWFIALGSAASDSSFTEITVTGYARVGVSRSTANFDNTAASSGTSHKTANTNAIAFGTPSGANQTATHVGLFDASSGGNCWIWIPLDNPITVGSSATVTLAAGLLQMVVGLTSGCSDYLANALVDLLFRAVAYTWPATIYLAAYTVSPTNAGGGTEVPALDYARVALVPSLSTLSGTQSAGSTVASSGASGAISNNGTLAYPTATTSWGTVVAEGFKDASTAGNLLLYGPLGSPKTVGVTAPLTHAAGSIVITVA
jgi:hypothetical protein